MQQLRDILLLQEDLNFLCTNRIPRVFVTRMMGRISRIESPLLTRIGIGLWRLFTDLDLSEAKDSRFRSLQACFTRELKAGARPVDPAPGIIVSPCDAIVGSSGPVEGTRVFQAKGFPYSVADLFGTESAAEEFRDGCYVTLRLTSAMYHRFHAPDAGRIERVTYHSGDTWNVNPIALKRVERLFCRNERAVLRMRLNRGGHPIALVPVAAILVASIRLHFLNVLLHLRFKGPHELPCTATFDKGQELGWFEHGSTLVVLAPPGFTLAPSLASGDRLRAGQALMVMPD